MQKSARRSLDIFIGSGVAFWTAMNPVPLRWIVANAHTAASAPEALVCAEMGTYHERFSTFMGRQ
jgi:hypothetical protein